LASEDRFLRHAARVALEHQPIDSWRQRVFKKSDVKNKLRPGAGWRVRLYNRTLLENDARMRLAALLALVRSAPEDSASEIVASLTTLKWDSLTTVQQLELLRIAGLVLIRGGEVGSDDQGRLATYLDSRFPAEDHRLNRELIQLLVRLEAPGIVPRMLDQLEQAVTAKHRIDYGLTISAAKQGWTLEARKRYFDWLQTMTDSKGGHSFFRYLKKGRERFIATFTEAEKESLKAEIAATFEAIAYRPVAETRPLVKKWNLPEVVTLANDDNQLHDFTKGRRLFSIAQCSNCHRIAGEGSAIGPDLTGAGRRLSRADLLRAIIEPSHQISDQYQQMVFETTNGKVIVGRILNLSGDSIVVSTNMADPDNNTWINRKVIDDQYPSKVSVMPAGLFDTLDSAEILDLLTYLRAGGEAGHELYESAQ